jgi:2-polyprenyl-3-methyl-5-hydroxy-6-metoxy-1,4-benzoquinol methylase
LTEKDASDWHKQTQNAEYLTLSSQRLNEPPLIWVSQFTQIINDFIGENNAKYVINDIGCNVGHFARNVELINADIAYRGIDISKTYLEIAKHHFPNLDFYIEDFAQKELNISQFECDISVVSATLEHIDDYEQFLSNIFKTTSQMVLIRTFLGETSEMDYCLKEGATQSYLIRQFVLSDLVNKGFKKDWLFEKILDEATLSKPKVICNSITRSQQILKFVKK